VRALKLEVITVAPNEQRVLMRFDQQSQSPDDERVRAYLQQHDLEPKKQYAEARDDTQYDVYYFGHCYLEGHLESLTGMASESSILTSRDPHPQSAEAWDRPHDALRRPVQSTTGCTHADGCKSGLTASGDRDTLNN
jgi:hypothetical protein